MRFSFFPILSLSFLFVSWILFSCGCSSYLLKISHANIKLMRLPHLLLFSPGFALTAKTRCWELTTFWWVSWTAVKRRATVLPCTRASAVAPMNTTSMCAVKQTSLHTSWVGPSQSLLVDMSKDNFFFYYYHYLFLCEVWWCVLHLYLPCKFII